MIFGNKYRPILSHTEQRTDITEESILTKSLTISGWRIMRRKADFRAIFSRIHAQFSFRGIMFQELSGKESDKFRHISGHFITNSRAIFTRPLTRFSFRGMGIMYRG